MLTADIKKLLHFIIQTNYKPFKLQQTGNQEPVTGNIYCSMFAADIKKLLHFIIQTNYKPFKL
ncbi:hypothetical protein, partial [Foetidibacter luteolus]|uniref:hypothetical protein n=1 Tax=Foetidibacter luteolus TaxID=2608880 RepID=UPI001A986F40